jgi:chromate transport protein ChrA
MAPSPGADASDVSTTIGEGINDFAGWIRNIALVIVPGVMLISTVAMGADARWRRARLARKAL